MPGLVLGGGDTVVAKTDSVLASPGAQSPVGKTNS